MDISGIEPRSAIPKGAFEDDGQLRKMISDQSHFKMEQPSMNSGYNQNNISSS